MDLCGGVIVSADVSGTLKHDGLPDHERRHVVARGPRAGDWLASMAVVETQHVHGGWSN